MCCAPTNKSYRKIYAQFPISEFLPILRNNIEYEKILLVDKLVNCSSVRLRLFATKECKCINCGTVATNFILESLDIKSADHPHLNLYGTRSDGTELLFTKDHILPKSLSGSDRLYNMQIMCIDCNNKKGSSIYFQDLIKILGQVITRKASIIKILKKVFTKRTN